LELGHKLPLNTYLLKPVQRISKYQLLLKELCKYSANQVEKSKLEKTLFEMLKILSILNDIMHSTCIVGIETSPKTHGRLIKRGEQLLMTKSRRSPGSTKNKLSKFNSKLVDVFLFKSSLIICKRKPTDDAASDLRSSLSMSLSSLSSNGYQGLNSYVFYQFKELVPVSATLLVKISVKKTRKNFPI
jgi:hypothetical protein